MPNKMIIASLVAAALVAVPVSSAAARGWHHHGRGFGGVFGVAGAVIAGAATIATAPIAIIAGAASRGGRGYYDGPPRDGYAEPPRGYPQSENYPPPGYSGGAPRYYPSQQAQYYGPRGDYGYDEARRGYAPSPPPEYYGSQPYYGPPQGYYAPNPRYYGPPPGY
jgi:hypothetical protein